MLELALIITGVIALMFGMTIPNKGTRRPWWIQEPKVPEARIYFGAGLDVAQKLRGLYPDESPEHLWTRAQKPEDARQLKALRAGFLSYFGASYFD